MKSPEFTTNAKQVLKDGQHMADAVTEADATEIADALRTSPLITFAEAERIGRELHDRWDKLSSSTVPLEADDMGWGDIVQFVLRRAHFFEQDRENV